jgi:hypothetical protein
MVTHPSHRLLPRRVVCACACGLPGPSLFPLPPSRCHSPPNLHPLQVSDSPSWGAPGHSGSCPPRCGVLVEGPGWGDGKLTRAGLAMGKPQPPTHHKRHCFGGERGGRRCGPSPRAQAHWRPSHQRQDVRQRTAAAPSARAPPPPRTRVEICWASPPSHSTTSLSHGRAPMPRRVIPRHPLPPHHPQRVRTCRRSTRRGGATWRRCTQLNVGRPV